MIRAQGEEGTLPRATAPATAGALDEPPRQNGVTRRYLRGSSLLLGGRFISIFLNLAVQVLTVRYLAKADYGAFAYALGIVSMSSSVILLGMGKAIPRFVPIYHERGDYARTFGSIALAVATVWGLGLSLMLLVFGLRDVISGTLITDPRAVSLLLVLIALAPLDAFDNLLQKLVAVFASARAIFYRRHVLGPSLKLAAVLLVIAVSGDVYLLAYGYLAGGLIGVWLYISILIRTWKKQHLLEHVRPGTLRWPARELFGFSIPLLSSELPVLLRGSLAVIFLEYFHTTAAVAEYRAVLPIAGLNMLVFEAFAFLFVPLASRMFARGERDGVSDLFWQTSLWITVLTFPAVVVTCTLATPVATMLFGTEYRTAGVVLAVLGAGFYFNASLGFNAATLRVHGRVGYLVAADLAAAVVFVALCLLLIPAHAALGAAVATTLTFVVHNLLVHLGLYVCDTGVRLFDWHFARLYLLALGLLLLMLLVQAVAEPPVLVSLALAMSVSLILIRLSRRILQPGETFPELLRIPLLKQLLTAEFRVR